MSWQTPLWTCGRPDWVGAYDDIDEPSGATEPRIAKPDLASATENARREAPTQGLEAPVSP